jgi:beta-lactamase regulating signal transducer with metallopeptidase domain
MLDHLLGSTLRGGALLLLAALLGLLCTRRSASLRHLLWALALGQLALLTAVGWLMPVWRWGALPAAPLQLVGPASGEGAPLAPGVTGPGTTALVGASSDGVAASAQAGVDAAAGSGIESAMIWLLLVWAAGALLLLSRCLRSLLAARRLVRGAAPVDDPALLAAAQGARSRLQLVMPFQLRISPAVDTALATGLLHPVVLLPAAARGWSAELLESVLTHELAHIQRRLCPAIAGAGDARHPLDESAVLAGARPADRRTRAGL